MIVSSPPITSAALPPPRLTEFRGFAAYLKKRRADRTAQKYLPIVERFLGWLGERTPGELSPAELEAYLDGWYEKFEDTHGKRPSNATQRAQVTALRCFFDFLERRELLVDGDGKEAKNRMALIETPERETKPIDYLSAEEDRALRDFRGKPHEEIIVALLRETGIRIGELRDLRISDVDLSQPGRETIRIRQSKTPAGRRTIPLPADLVLRLEKWLIDLKARGLYRVDGPLVPTKRGTAPHPQWIDRLVKRVAASVGVRPTPCTCGNSTLWGHAKGCPRTVTGEHRSDISPHHLRRTYATHLLNQGMKIEVVSRLLGHTSVAITQTSYAELLDEQVHAEFERVCGYRLAA